jgi:hypothetical protein
VLGDYWSDMTKKQVLSVTDLFDVSPDVVPEPGPSGAAIPAQIHRSRRAACR